GRFNPIDWYALRDGRIVAYVELKTRSHGPDAFPTVFLNQRKWLALTMSFVYTAVPSIFAVRFAGDEVRWIEVDRIDARRLEIAGCRQLVKARTDREPVIHVPIAEMHVLKTRRESA
ncbi:hypothetical protein, partial [Paludisphaera soli]|uniref:hypothetical protein n=1 Tax=Paludisphaera soli TaxID=2712865 RepID=UPI0013EA3AA4